MLMHLSQDKYPDRRCESFSERNHFTLVIHTSPYQPPSSTATTNMQDPTQSLTALLSILSPNGERSGHGPLGPPPLRRLGCANQNISSHRLCPNDATQTCSGCFLVRYCSKECQTEHWKFHKQDCKSPLKSKSWSPAWVRENRKPAFVNGPDDDTPQKAFGIPMELWGNMTVHRHRADEICKKDLSLAFIASGDLRNVVRTVNELPENYAGTLKIVLNDKNCRIVSRNLIILTIPCKPFTSGTQVLQPLSYQFLVFPLLPDAPTLQHLDVHTRWDPLTTTFLISLLTGDEIDLSQAKDTWSRTMHAPGRVDHLALDAWRRSGLLLPFGARTDHMCVPNAWLFSNQGDLLLIDSSNPLVGWDYTEVVKAGKAHGTTEDDLMGSMFFYVKDQLVEFSKRLRRFKIHIYSYDKDAKDLPAVLRSDVSSPKTNPYAAILGLFMNWTIWKKEGQASSSKTTMHRAMKEMASFHSLYNSMNKLDAFHDTSIAFREYLNEEKADWIARKVELKYRRINKIVPHRCFAELGTSPSSLPCMSTADKWYAIACLGNSSCLERYVEWVKVPRESTILVSLS
ncbi:hypothetical protein IW261DRAFT_1432010 [Armillaria novae-zelandiae]|uniref:MYND-type domain-containing protein n=1 Tax=Armillaria novae-zelandiae TaxID=153914 RepID=A0AA39PWK6_9AGAR|nr:hypothetical protein IW261DRAFT_1432010 [Armillaria novae-zelandiae]